jgi:hypothetical protein
MQFVIAAQLNPQGPSQYTLTVWEPNTLKRDDGTPAQPDDVVSVQPDGSLQTRPAGTHGSWEVCTLSGVTLLYRVGERLFWVIPAGI